MTNLFQTGGNWYKGNLHAHTALSDGKLLPGEVIRIYQKAGYDFLALTDHWVQSETGSKDGLVLLPGCEFDNGKYAGGPVFHIVGVGMRAKVELDRSRKNSPQTIIDAVRAAGGLAILAHPAWSLTDPAAMRKLQGLSGAEIYNTTSGIPWNARPDSGLYFDLCANEGKLLRCMAADDCHWFNGDETRSYLMVNAPAKTPEALLQAIGGGNFYASQGPGFESVVYDGETVTVYCTEAAAVIFYSNTVWCGDRVAVGHLTSAAYQIKPTDRYVRVELIDGQGRRAWCSPFAVNASV